MKDNRKNPIRITLEGEIDDKTLDRLERLDKTDPEAAYMLQDFITDFQIFAAMMLKGWELK
jgi:hypothetical protein